MVEYRENSGHRDDQAIALTKKDANSGIRNGHARD